MDQCTIDIIEELSRRKGINRNKVLRQILTELISHEVTADSVSEFYRDVWSLLVSDSHKSFVGPIWPEELDEALVDLSEQVLGVANRSEMIRVLVAYFGIRVGVARVKTTKALRLDVVSSQGSDVA